MLRRVEHEKSFITSGPGVFDDIPKKMLHYFSHVSH